MPMAVPPAGAWGWAGGRPPAGAGTGGVMGLSEEMTSGGARPAWLGYIGVDDIDAATSAIEAAGGKVLMPKMTIPQGSLAMVADCCGAPFYVMTPDMPEGQMSEGQA